MMPPWGGRQKPRDSRRGERGRLRRAGLGILYLAVGRREGFDEFGNSVDAYLSSLAPLVAFDIVTNVLLAASGKIHAAALVFLVTLCVMLAAPVVSHPICRRWGVAEFWPRYANILNWAQMLMFLVLGVAGIGVRILAALGVPEGIAGNSMQLAILCYAVWLQWFVARGALRVNWWRTALLLLAYAAANMTLAGLFLLTSAHLKIN